MKKVLQIVGGLGIGGLQQVAINYYQYIDRDQYSFDYVVYGQEIGVKEQEVIDLGGRIFHITNPNENFRKFYHELELIIKNEGPYDIVHGHTLFNSGYALKLAYKYNVPIRVAQAHNSQRNRKRTLPKKIYQSVMRKWIKKYATHFLAVSDEAGEFVFGKEFYHKHGNFIINGIPVEKYKYNPDKNLEFKVENNFVNKKIIGHTGRLAAVKNQEFIINLMPDLLKHDPNFVALLVGEGEDHDKLQNLINKLDLKDSVFLLGGRSDVPDLLNNFDIFLFPSMYEGLPLSLLEAQSAGLPSVISENMTDQVILNNSVYKIPLSNKEEWVNKILELRNFDRENEPVLVEEKGFGITTMMEKAKNIYESEVE